MKCNRSYARPADPTWGVAFPKILWQVQSQMDVDSAKEFLEEMFDPLAKFVAQMQSMADPDGLLTWGKLGDWYFWIRSGKSRCSCLN